MKKLRIFTALILAIAIIYAGAFSVFAADTKDFKPYEDSRFFSLGDYDIHYRIIPAQGETKGRILMLHGFMCSTYSWRNMAKEMSALGYECVLADLPDFGFSTREKEGMEIIPREDLMIALMESIAPASEWIVAGHSMGGGVAINIACMTDIKALLLYCPCPQDEFPAWAEKLVKTGFTENTMDIFFRLGSKLSPVVRMVIWMATADLRFALDYDLSGVTDPLLYEGFGKGICEMMYNVRATDLESAKNLKIPVLLCQADKDIILNSDQKARINETFDGAYKYTVEDAGHQCIENRSEELAKVTGDFLSENNL
ncbi:MAG: alpha/beta hydrolase [Clostridia bacterium]|nr:alpha/beta hydrolase [Clostridia bacterium]